MGGPKRQVLVVNGVQSGTVQFPDAGNMLQKIIGIVFLKQGPNQIQLIGYEGFAYIQSVGFEFAQFQGFRSIEAAPASLPDSSDDVAWIDGPQDSNDVEEAGCTLAACNKRRKLLQYFKQTFGKAIISGQQEWTGMSYIKNLVGDYPVIQGVGSV